MRQKIVLENNNAGPVQHTGRQWLGGGAKMHGVATSCREVHCVARRGRRQLAQIRARSGVLMPMKRCDHFRGASLETAIAAPASYWTVVESLPGRQSTV